VEFEYHRSNIVVFTYFNSLPISTVDEVVCDRFQFH